MSTFPINKVKPRRRYMTHLEEVCTVGRYEANLPHKRRSIAVRIIRGEQIEYSPHGVRPRYVRRVVRYVAVGDVTMPDLRQAVRKSGAGIAQNLEWLMFDVQLMMEGGVPLADAVSLVCMNLSNLEHRPFTYALLHGTDFAQLGGSIRG